MNSFFKTLCSLTSIIIISIFQFGCGEGFFADPALLEQRSSNRSAGAESIELREGYVLVGDLAVHRSQVHEEDLKNFFPIITSDKEKFFVYYISVRALPKEQSQYFWSF